MRVTLTQSEICMATAIGVARAARAIAYRLQHTPGTPKTVSTWHNNIEGAMGELAVAKALRLYFDGGLDSWHVTADVGRNIQVRTCSGPNYRLLVNPKDSIDDEYVLVRGMCPTYDIVGIIAGRLAKLPDYWDDEFQRYVVPTDKLRPFTEEEVENLRAAQEQHA